MHSLDSLSIKLSGADAMYIRAEQIVRECLMGFGHACRVDEFQEGMSLLWDTVVAPEEP